MSKLSVLKSELTDDPNVVGYSGMTDQECLASLQLKDIPTNLTIQTKDIEMYLESVDKLYTIRNHASDAAKKVTQVFDRFDSFDMTNTYDDAVLNARLDAMVTATVISQAEKDLILALGDTLISRADQLGLGSFGIGAIIDARV